MAVTGSAVIHSAAVAVVRSAPDDAARSTSRSVTMPVQAVAPVDDDGEPNRPLVMALAISATMASVVTV